MPSPMMDPPLYSPVFPPMTQQMEPSTDIPPIGVSMLMNNPSMDIPPIGLSTSMNNNQNNSDNLPPSTPLSDTLNWNDEVMTLLDDPFFKNINVPDPISHQ